jgi:hypothetical protein
MSQPGFKWKVDECSGYFNRLHLRGWCCDAPKPVIGVKLEFEQSGSVHQLLNFGLESPDIAGLFGLSALYSRFDEWIPCSPADIGTPFKLYFILLDGTVIVGDDAMTNAAWGDPYFQSWENFISALDRFPSGRVLELGSRARSAVTRKHRIPARLDYLGIDILAGPNVDVVGDVHELGKMFPNERFVAAFSVSVFEHLAMPWKAAIELNRVLELGGIVYTSTHQAWPVHEEPWDFWRFSKFSWQALFNSATGFDLLEAVVGEPARIHACRATAVTKDMPESLAYLGSASLAKKTGEATVSWNVPLSVATSHMYPPGELSQRPTSDRV